MTNFTSYRKSTKKKYQNSVLKEKIVDPGMWNFIPGVSPIPTKDGLKRLKENDPLFSFIDKYMSDIEFDFEPLMEDGRFICLPANPAHQGFGICVSKQAPETYLEICHFWYPAEFTNKKFTVIVDQLYMPEFLFNIDNPKMDLVLNKIKTVSPIMTVLTAVLLLSVQKRSLHSKTIFLII